MMRDDVTSPYEADNDDEDETREIRVEIEQTRTELSGTIDAIQEKLDPQVLTEQAKEVATHAIRDATEHAKEAVKDATVGKVEQMASSTVDNARGMGNSLMDRIKQNPVPAALAGLSIGWLLMKDSPSKHQAASYSSPASRRPMYGDFDASRRMYVDQDQDEGSVGKVAHKIGDAAHEAQDRAARVASSAGESAGDFTSSLMETVKQNPVPAALTAMGVGWLVMNRRGSNDDYPYGRYDRDAWPYQTTTSSGYGDTSDEQGTVDQLKERAAGAMHQVQETSGDVVDTVQEAAGHVASTVQRTAGEVGHRAQRAPGQLGHMIQENPLMAGALAVSVGAAVGLYLPSTKREDQMVGERRDALMTQVRGTARETFEKVQHVADEATTTIKEQVKEQGLTT